LSPQEIAEAKDLVKTYPDAFVAKLFDVHVKTLRSALYPRNIVRPAS